VDVLKVEAAAADVIHHPARGADNHLDTALERAQLHPVVLSPEDRQGTEVVEMATVLLEGVGDLEGQFPGRGEDEDLRVNRLLGFEVHQQRQGEGGSLAGPGLGLADDVAAGEHMGNHPALDRCRAFIPGIFEGLEQGAAELEVGEQGCGVGVCGHANSFGGTGRPAAGDDGRAAAE